MDFNPLNNHKVKSAWAGGGLDSEKTLLQILNKNKVVREHVKRLEESKMLSQQKKFANIVQSKQEPTPCPQPLNCGRR